MKVAFIVAATLFVTWLMLEQFVYDGKLHSMIGNRIASAFRKRLGFLFRRASRNTVAGNISNNNLAENMSTEHQLVLTRDYVDGHRLPYEDTSENAESKDSIDTTFANQKDSRTDKNYRLTVVNDGFDPEFEQPENEWEIMQDPEQVWNELKSQVGTVLDEYVIYDDPAPVD